MKLSKSEMISLLACLDFEIKQHNMQLLLSNRYKNSVKSMLLKDSRTGKGLDLTLDMVRKTLDVSSFKARVAEEYYQTSEIYHLTPSVYKLAFDWLETKQLENGV